MSPWRKCTYSERFLSFCGILVPKSAKPTSSLTVTLRTPWKKVKDNGDLQWGLLCNSFDWKKPPQYQFKLRDFGPAKKIWRCFRYWQSVILKGKHLMQNIKLSWAESFQIRMVWLVDKKFPVQKVLQEKTCRCGWRKLMFEWFRTSTKQYQMVWNEWWYYRMILTLWSF